MIKILNLGAGIQSSTLLLMSCLGELPKLDHAIFADTGWEPDEVYEHLTRLVPFAGKHDIPVHVVRKGNIRDDMVKSFVRGTKGTGARCASMPLFTNNGGRIRRQCTEEYKIEPIERFIRREIFGMKPRQRMPMMPVVEQWFGISADEKQRMTQPHTRWQCFEYPLVGFPFKYLERQYTREDCERWLKDRFPDWKVPRSACLGCPFHSNDEWRRLLTNPKYLADIVDFDEHIRKAGGMRRDTFIHRTCKPIIEAMTDLEEAPEGQCQFCFL